MNELFQVIKNNTETNITQNPAKIIINMAMALVLGAIYSYVYRLTYTAKPSSQLYKEMRKIQFTLILLSLGGAFIWIVVADNLVRAFGLAGALSLIRFRTTVKDPKNTIKVFYAIIIGMACGLSQYYTAIIGTAFICLSLVIIYFLSEKEKQIED